MTSKMHIEDRFECSAKTLLSLILDPTFDAAVMKAIGMKKELVEEQEKENGKVEVVRMTPSSDLPSFVKKIVGGANNYVETHRWNFATMTNEWSEKTGFATDKIDVDGTFVIKPIANGSCTRIVDGSFSVRIPLVGKKIEEYIIEQTRESFRKTTVFTRSWIKDKGLTGK